MTSPRLPLVKAQQSFLSGIRLSRELHGPKVKVTAPPIKKTEVRNSRGFSFEVRKITLRFKHHKTSGTIWSENWNFLTCTCIQNVQWMIRPFSRLFLECCTFSLIYYFVCYFPRFLILRNTITSDKTKYRMIKPQEFRTFVFLNRWRCYFHFESTEFSTQANSW